jgi:uncharacterized membrane protein
MDDILFILVCAAATGSAIVGGIFYGFSSFVMRALTRLGTEQGIAAMNSINREVITPSFMVPFAGTALLCAALAAVSILWWRQAGGPLVLTGALAYLVANFGLTLVVNQPMNLRLAAMSPTQAAAHWPHYVRVWTAWNHVRTAASILAAALFVADLVYRR